MNIKKIIKIVVLASLVGAGIHICVEYRQQAHQAAYERRILEVRQQGWQHLEFQLRDEINRFKGESGILIKDLKTGWEFSHAKDKLFASASLAKVPVMGACFLAAEQGQINLENGLALKGSDKLTGSGTLKEMPTGTIYSIQKLIDLMISESDNTATHMLTNFLSLNYLNEVFEYFGLKHTRLERKIADYQMRDKGYENYTSAEDMGMLFEKIYTGNLVNTNYSDQGMSILKNCRTNDRIPKLLPEGSVVAHKTGLENGICHDAGIVFTPLGDLMIIVLTGHQNANSNPSKEFIANIALHTYNYLDNHSKEIVLLK